MTKEEMRKHLLDTVREYHPDHMRQGGSPEHWHKITVALNHLKDLVDSYNP